MRELARAGKKTPTGSKLMSGGRFSMAGRMCSRDVELARLSLQADVRAHRRREKVATEIRAMNLA